MPRMRKLSKDEIRVRRADISARARAGKLSLPSAIREIRHALGLNQEEFAKLFRLTLRQVKELERGVANPTAETLNRIAKVFGFNLGFVPRPAAGQESVSGHRQPEQASTDE
jgi:putative transcriptional regulator